jgi:hypothetical protein
MAISLGCDENISKFLIKYCNDNLENYLNRIVVDTGEIWGGKSIKSPGNILNYKEKSFKRMYYIISQINKFINSSTYILSKKYQVRGYYEYKIVSKYCKFNNIKHEFIKSDNNFTNKIIKLEQYCFYGEDEPVLHKGHHIKVPCIFIKVYKNENIIQVDKNDINDID